LEGRSLRLLYASERPPFPFFLGGAARSAHYLLSTLAREHGVRVMSVGSLQFDGRRWSAADIQDRETLQVSGVEDDGRSVRVHGEYPAQLVADFYDALPALIDQEAPDVVWTQLDGFQRIADIARARGRDTLVYLRDAEDPPAALRAVAQAGCALVCNSEFMAGRVEVLTGRRAAVIYPSLESRFGVRADPDGFVTMINPVPVKGVDTFLAVAEALPQQRFLLVESWKLGADALAALHGRLARLPNVQFMHRVADVGEVYARTRLLLVPSRWEEAFGRVVIEAQSCGIPVLASRRGGLPESVGDDGMVVDDHANPQAWIAAMRPLLDDPVRYRDEATRALAHADDVHFTTAHAARRLLDICSDRTLFGGRPPLGLGRWIARLRRPQVGARP
jgi:glycosyltransferase involved in cell wall biosynthesis